MNHKMSVFYFPSTVVSVDDNKNFLGLIETKIGKLLPCKNFSNPLDALQYLQTESNKENILSNSIELEEMNDKPNISIDVEKISEIAYQPNRFDTISVVVVDYAMPEINGADFCRELKDSRFKLILLTGEAGADKAIELFNEGTIDCYINKHESDYLLKLNSAIISLQKEYFSGISSTIVQAIINKHAGELSAYSSLADPIFIKFFNDFIIEHKITEYYLLDEIGSFLLLNTMGEVSWLIVKNEDDMMGADDETNDADFKIDPKLRKAIENREVLKFICNYHLYDPEPSDPKQLNDFYYPATQLKDKNIYYISHIKKSMVPALIDKDRILSYHEYLNSKS